MLEVAFKMERHNFFSAYGSNELSDRGFRIVLCESWTYITTSDLVVIGNSSTWLWIGRKP